eukprot:TRINITY_DN23777_c0_g1_i1.p1 TRINITY_DN23777_c0_g1~~TRINITY_DN23777_c0_g1_i1.p1  ORF type:complete len:465 (-),score=58.33 TRINITY_DN23777_c0_g1_i1:171-1565(-)
MAPKQQQPKSAWSDADPMGFNEYDDDDDDDAAEYTSNAQSSFGFNTGAKRTANPYPSKEMVPRGAPGQPQQPKLDEDGLPMILKFTRKKMSTGALMGRCKRSPMTGEIILEKPPEFPNFQVVDLAGRRKLPRSRYELEKDPFLFKPVPLMYRTWLYQSMFTSGTTITKSSDTDFIIKKTLAFFCLDVQMWDTRWSPMVAYAYIMFLSALTCDAVVILAAALLGVLSGMLSVAWNSPFTYRYDRLLTLPLRIGYLALLAMLFPSVTTLETIGSVLTITCVALELIVGDLRLLTTYRFHCSYEVVSSLGCRCFVCIRHGAATLYHEFKKLPFGLIDEKLTGVPLWTQNHHLICELDGFMVELKPMTKDDWQRASREYNWHLKALTFISLPVVDDQSLKSNLAPLEESQLYEDDVVPMKPGRQARKGTIHMNSLSMFRDTRAIFDGVDHLDWMIEEVESHEKGNTAA